MSRPHNILKTIALTAWGIGALAAATGAALVYFQPRLGGDTGAMLGVPTSGNVRVISTVLEKSATRVHVKWSFIGSQNWSKAEGNSGVFTLSGSYPLNDTTRKDGCHVYEADLVADAKTGKWIATLHGSDGTTVQAEGTLPASKPLSESVTLRQTAPSASVGTNATLTLAQIGDTPLTMTFAR